MPPHNATAGETKAPAIPGASAKAAANPPPRNWTSGLHAFQSRGRNARLRTVNRLPTSTHNGLFNGASPRFNTVLVSTFAAIAFLMAVVGVYGVLAFSVAQRRQEIGIRMALGASPSAVLGLVMKEGALLLAMGTLSGVAGALALTRYLTFPALRRHRDRLPDLRGGGGWPGHSSGTGHLPAGAAGGGC
jgi:ABC-type antimicrobial peptide transport system permease subunit